MTQKTVKKDRKSPPQNKPGGEGENKFQWKQAGKTSVVWIVILVVAIFLSNLFTAKNRNEVEVQYFQYKDFLTSGAILEAEVIEK